MALQNNGREHLHGGTQQLKGEKNQVKDVGETDKGHRGARSPLSEAGSGKETRIDEPLAKQRWKTSLVRDDQHPPLERPRLIRKGNFSIQAKEMPDL